MKRLIRGFTMIELLVVIAIIGVLAAAVLSAINPVEQINKGRDTGQRSDAAEMVNAMERYFAVHEFWPWLGVCASGITPCTYDCNATTLADCGNDGVDALYEWDGINGVDTGGGGGTVVDNWQWIMDETDEVKPNFVERLQNNEAQLYLYKPFSEGVVYSCFQPSSNQFRAEALERCRAEASVGWVAGATADTLPDAAEANICIFDDLVDGSGDPNLICVP